MEDKYSYERQKEYSDKLKEVIGKENPTYIDIRGFDEPVVMIDGRVSLEQLREITEVFSEYKEGSDETG